MPNTSYGTPYVAGSDLVSAYPTASLNLANRLDEVSYRRNGLNAQTGTSYTLVVGDAGKTVTLSNASAVAVSLPQDSAANLPTGSIVTFYNLGAGVVTISQGTGATLQGGSIILPQFANVTVMKLSANTYGRVDGLGQPGVVLVTSQSFSAVSSLSVNNCFSATYENYLITLTITSAPADSDISLRLRVGGVDNSTASSYVLNLLYATGSSALAVSVSESSLNMGSVDSATTDYALSTMVYGPFAARRTLGTYSSSNIDAAGNFYVRNGSWRHTQAVSYDGLTLLGTTAITGSLRVYGYRNSL